MLLGLALICVPHISFYTASMSMLTSVAGIARASCIPDSWSTPVQEFHTTLRWGPLGEPEAWRRPPPSLLQDFFQALSGAYSLLTPAQQVQADEPVRDSGPLSSPQIPAAGSFSAAAGPSLAPVTASLSEAVGADTASFSAAVGADRASVSAAVGADTALQAEYSLNCVEAFKMGDGGEPSVVFCDALYADASHPPGDSGSLAGPGRAEEAADFEGGEVLALADQASQGTWRCGASDDDAPGAAPAAAELALQESISHRNADGRLEQKGELVAARSVGVQRGSAQTDGEARGEGLSPAQWAGCSGAGAEGELLKYAVARVPVGTPDVPAIPSSPGIWLPSPQLAGNSSLLRGRRLLQQTT
jgi:hypothetical protein